MTFESGFADVERAVDAATKNVTDLSALLRDLKKAARVGDTLQLRKATARLANATESLHQQVGNIAAAWPFTAETELAYLKESYANELLQHASSTGIQLEQRDDVLVAFPSIVRVLAAERALRIDRERIQALRPSAVVLKLKALQSKKPKVPADQFLEVLHRAYKLLVGQNYGVTIALSNVYETLTLLPGSSAAYDPTDFVRDVFLLDRSGIRVTKSGAHFSLPASTGTKGNRGVYSFFGPNGEAISYYGLRFEEAVG